MAISVDWSVTPRLITVPLSDLTLETGTKYTLTVNELWQLLRDFSDSAEAVGYQVLYKRIPSTASTPAITEIDENYYAIQFEDGLYSVNITGGNSNVREVEVKNQVSVNTNNTTGFTDHTSEAIDHIEKAVWIDTSAVAAGDGSQAAPFNTVTAGIDYAEATGITLLYLYDDVVLDRQLKNFKIVGIGNPTVDTNGQDLTKSEFFHCNMEGTYIGIITVQEAVLLPGFYLNGYFEKCGLGGDLICVDGGAAVLVGCISVIPGLSRPTISMNATGTSQLSLRKNGGGMTIKDCNQVTDTVTVEVSEGSLTFDASCTDGDMVARGSCKFVDETIGATVTDETTPVLVWAHASAISLSIKVAEAWQLLGLDASNPLVVSATQQLVDAITLNITGTTTKTVTRV